jgi:hypothetical protein
LSSVNLCDPAPDPAYHIDADPDPVPVFYANPDPDADPGYQNDADPCRSGSKTLVIGMDPDPLSSSKYTGRKNLLSFIFEKLCNYTFKIL